MVKRLNRYEALLFVLGALAIAYVLAFVPLHNLLGDLVFLPAALLVDALGAQVIAEGIMTSDQLGRLRALGCDAGQGFLFCEPRTSEAAIAWLLETSEKRPDRTLE